MGILTRLRNAFGKSRKGESAVAADPSTSAAEQTEPTVPAARQETAPESTPAAAEPEAPVPAPAEEATADAGSESGSTSGSKSGATSDSGRKAEPKASVVDELVSAAFDNVTVPKQAKPTE